MNSHVCKVRNRDYQSMGITMVVSCIKGDQNFETDMGVLEGS